MVAAVGAGIRDDRALRQLRSIWRISHVEDLVGASRVDDTVEIVESADIELGVVVEGVAGVEVNARD